MALWYRGDKVTLKALWTGRHRLLPSVDPLSQSTPALLSLPVGTPGTDMRPCFSVYSAICRWLSVVELKLTIPHVRPTFWLLV